jgi:hypothetical protein
MTTANGSRMDRDEPQEEANVVQAFVSKPGEHPCHGADAAAQSCSGNGCAVNNTASVTVATLLRLTLNSATTSLTSPDEAAFDLGSQDDFGPTATVKANRPWNLTIAAQAATWTGTNGGRADKAAGDLQWKVGAGSFASLSTTAGNVYGSSQGASGNASTAFLYRTLWSYAADVPGDYALTVVYTLTAP